MAADADHKQDQAKYIPYLKKHLIPVYRRLPVCFTHGKGAWLWDAHGNKYLDALAGIAVNGLGHAHPRVVETICRQSARLIHTSNVYEVSHQEKLADSLCRMSGMQQVFFANSGAEANETAIKLSRLHGVRRGIAKSAIIVMENSFHGRTMAALTATGNRRIREGFEPLLEGFVRVPFNDIDSIRKVAARHDNIVAVLLEPIQGEGGIHICGHDFLTQLDALCRKNDWLLMLDEVQSGVGRTGRFCCFQHYGVVPDVATLGKGLGNGIPVSACLVSRRAVGLFQPGQHGTTLGGNPFACAVAHTVLQAIAEDDLCQQAQRAGDALAERIEAALGGEKKVRRISHKGLMMGIELAIPCGELAHRALGERLLINVTADNVVRLLPPLIISAAEIDVIATTVIALIEEFIRQN